MLFTEKEHIVKDYVNFYKQVVVKLCLCFKKVYCLQKVIYKLNIKLIVIKIFYLFITVFF